MKPEEFHKMLADSCMELSEKYNGHFFVVCASPKSQKLFFSSTFNFHLFDEKKLIDFKQTILNFIDQALEEKRKREEQ